MLIDHFLQPARWSYLSLSGTEQEGGFSAESARINAGKVCRHPRL